MRILITLHGTFIPTECHLSAIFVLRAATNWVLFYLFYLQKALRNKAMDIPEPRQWDNEDSENTTAVELQDPYLDSVPCTESEDSEGSDEN
jgi:hypothetical protein